MAQVEQQQSQVAGSFQPAAEAHEFAERERLAQRARERAARPLLLLQLQQAGGASGGALATLNEYRVKTKASVLESWSKSSGNDAGWCCRLTYTSVLRSATAAGSAAGKKAAKSQAAGALLTALYNLVG